MEYPRRERGQPEKWYGEAAIRLAEDRMDSIISGDVGDSELGDLRGYLEGRDVYVPGFPGPDGSPASDEDRAGAAAVSRERAGTLATRLGMGLAIERDRGVTVDAADVADLCGRCRDRFGTGCGEDPPSGVAARRTPTA